MIRRLSMSAAVAIVATAASASAQSELARAVADMEPGEWRELATEGMGPTFLETGGSSGFILGYSESMRWDSASGRAFFLGADHGPADYRIAVYDEADNSWSVLPSPSWAPEPGGGYISHGYDHLAIDRVGRRLFTRTFNSNHLRVLDLDAMSWTDAPDPPFADEGGSCCDSLDWFPELGALVWSRGYDQIWRYDVATTSWTLIDEGNEITGTWTYAEYNPIHHVMVLGSAAGGRFYRLAADGALSELGTPPISVYDGSAWNGIFTVDPVSGDYLVLTPTARELYTFDVTTDAWERSTHQPTVDIMDGGLVAAPIDTYGVTMLAHCESGACRTFLYKHSPGGGTPPPPRRDAGSTDADGGVSPAIDAGATMRVDGGSGTPIDGETEGGCGCAMTSPSAAWPIALVCFAVVRRRTQPSSPSVSAKR